MNAFEDVRVNITVSASDEHASLELKLVLLATLLLLSLTAITVFTLRLVFTIRIFVS